MSEHPDIRILMYHEDSTYATTGGNTRRIYAVIAGVDDDPGRPGYTRVVNHYGNAALYNLGLSAYVDRDTQEGAWGFRLEYRDLYSVGLHDAEDMVRMLRKVQRKLDSLRTTYGEPTDYAGAVARFAQAVGATHYGWKVPADRDMTGTGYRWTADATDMQYHVERLITEYRKGA